MAGEIKNRLLQGRLALADASQGKKIVGLLLFVALAAVMAWNIFGGRKAEYEVLYSRLSPKDAGAIVEELKKNGTPYKLSGEGAVIELPAGLAQETRLQLAMLGLPREGNVGLEIFDSQKFGATDFSQKVNLQRAVTGELERTIAQFPEVEAARVHLSVPQDVLFIEDQSPPKASVMLRLRPGADLDKAKLLGVVHLMTSAVEGLTPENISVVDADGGLLWSQDQLKAGLLNDDQLKKKQAYEKQLADRVTTMLERLVGPDRVAARVSAELEMREVVTNEDIYDPERTAPRSEHRSQLRVEGGGRAAVGAPNATYELGTGNRSFSASDGQPHLRTETSETTNYEITNIKRQTVAASGDLRRLTVSVVVDGSWSEGEDGQKVFTPVPVEQLDKMTELVKNTVGYDEARGDKITVVSNQFYRPEEIPVWTALLFEFLREFYRPFINILLLLCFFFFVVRPLINWLKKDVEPAGALPEPAVLPELPAGPGPAGEGLSLPQELETAREIQDETKLEPQMALASRPLSPADYSDVVPESNGPPPLTRGNLYRENVLPVARDNLDKTITQLRHWIEEPPPLPKSGGR